MYDKIHYKLKKKKNKVKKKKKKAMNELIYKTEIEPHHRKQTYGYQRGKRQGTN